MYNKISDIDLSSCADILNQMLKENYSVDVKKGFYYNGNNLIARTVPLGNTNEYEYKELTGDVVTFNDAVPYKNIKKLEVEINPVQEGSGDPSPENVRPITGWDSIHVYHSGADTSDPDTVTVQMPTPPGTVYGGTLNVTNGILTVTHKCVEFEGTESEIWERVWGNASPAFRIYLSSVKEAKYNSTGIFSAFNYTNINSTTGLGAEVENSSSGTQLLVRYDDMPSTVDGWKSILAEWKNTGTPLQAMYELAEPVTYHLTPQEVKTLLGTNTIWADSGDVSVKYLAKI